jgi:ABC-type anion transport system duplicated permease subunit
MIPAAAPYIFTGLRIGIGLSWLAIVAAEMLIGGVEVPLARLRKRLELATSPGYLKCRQRVLEFLYERHRFVEAA